MILQIARHKLGPPSRQQVLDWMCFQVSWLVAKGARLDRLDHVIAPVDGLGTASQWQVSAGGRMGFVVGEDAQEGGCAA